MAQTPHDNNEKKSNDDQSQIDATAEKCVLGIAIGQFTVSINIGRSDAKTKLYEIMPVSCHPELDWLLRYSDWTAKDLLSACSAKALGCRNGKLVRQFKWPDYSAGALGITYFFGWFAVFTLLLIVRPTSTDQNAGLTAALVFTACSMASIAVYHFWPQFIAGRAIQFLEKSHPFEKSGAHV